MERRHPRSRLALFHLVILSWSVSVFTWAELVVDDTQLRNLLISVKNNNEGRESGQQQSVSGGIKRDKVFIGTGQPVRPAQEGLTIRHEGLAYNTVNTQRTFSSLSEQKIRAVEGYPAFLYTGQSIKLSTQDSEGNPYLEEVDALQGFYVSAQLAGDRVILTISLSRDSFEENDPSRTRQADALLVNTEGLSTTVSGRIGEWIDLGGITLSDAGSDQSQAKKTTTRSSSIGNISVKIQPLD